MSNLVKNIVIPLLIAITAFLSYHYNFFRVTSDKLFAEYQLESEQRVLDGILHGSDHGQQLTLGNYSRPEIENQYILAHQLYQEQNKDGVFEEYRSQFGLQLYLFKFLAEMFRRDVSFLQSVSSLLMSIVVALFFVAIRREFSFNHALFFCLPLIFSPWVVIFARNLYWVEATWFLPTVITLLLGKSALHSLTGALIMGVMLFAAFLVKMLCGYEYLTAIALSACVPLCYYTVQHQFGLKRGLSRLLICGMSLALAFLAAVSLHAYQLSGSSDNPFHQIMLIASKRLSTNNTAALAKEWCQRSPDTEQCQQDFIAGYTPSLTSNRLLVTLKYFAMPHHFFPWFDRAVFNSADKAALKEVRDKLTLKSFQFAFASISFQTMIYFAAHFLGFLVFNVWVWRVALKRRDSLSVALLLSIMAPLSWFFLAKGHSYDHYHLNYVLWYLPYVPFGMLLLYDQLITQHGRVAA